ncbi:MAG: hypothetical protein ACR2PI_18920 [Hyphomicrobiaceae bacterium]
MLEKRERLNQDFWSFVKRSYQLRRRMQHFQSDDHVDPANRTLTSMLRELTSLPARKISASHARGYPSDEVAHCSIPAMKEEAEKSIRDLENELEELRAYASELGQLDHEMRDQRLSDWARFPIASSEEERNADTVGIQKLKTQRSRSKR